jgi:hypothetical protein
MFLWDWKALRKNYFLYKISWTIVLQTRLVKTSFKIAVRSGFKTRLIRHCNFFYRYYGLYIYDDYYGYDGYNLIFYFHTKKKKKKSQFNFVKFDFFNKKQILILNCVFLWFPFDNYLDKNVQNCQISSSIFPNNIF